MLSKTSTRLHYRGAYNVTDRKRHVITSSIYIGEPAEGPKVVTVRVYMVNKQCLIQEILAFEKSISG